MAELGVERGAAGVEAPERTWQFTQLVHTPPLVTKILYGSHFDEGVEGS